jgi:hypothetical protein
VLGYGLDDQRFESQQGLRIFLLTTTSRLALGPTLPPIPWVPGFLSLGVKWPGHEDDHSPPSSAKVKECTELYLHSPNVPSWHGAQTKNKKSTGTLPFTFTFNRDEITEGWRKLHMKRFIICTLHQILIG